MKNLIEYEEIQKKFNELLKNLKLEKTQQKQNEALTQKDHDEINQKLLIFKKQLLETKQNLSLREKMKNLRVSRDCK